VEEGAFAQCSVLAIAFPMHVDTIRTSAFRQCYVGLISIDSGNPWLQIHGDFLCDFGQRRLATYLGRAEAITIPDAIELIRSFCFTGNEMLRSIAFGPGLEFVTLPTGRF
jgi:hypothetical protein